MAQPLPTAVLGRTGLEVTRLGYGSAQRSPMTDDQAKSMLNAVLESGINFIDTANDYGDLSDAKTMSEGLIGRHISHRAAEFYLATKCGCAESSTKLADHIWTRENLFRGLHESLGRLKADAVDIMQLHNPSVEDCERGNLVDALQDMQQQGKVRWIGVSTTLPHLPTFLEWGVFDVFQIPYSALQRDHEGWITKAAEAGIGIIIRGGVARGEPGVGTGSTENWQKFEDSGLGELLQEGENPTTFMLRYTLTHPDVQTIIVGTTNPDHLRENVQAVHRGPLPADVYAEAKRRLDAAGIKPAAVE